jgi:hypothetical protein
LPLACRKAEVADFSGNRLGRVMPLENHFLPIDLAAFSERSMKMAHCSK